LETKKEQKEEKRINTTPFTRLYDWVTNLEKAGELNHTYAIEGNGLIRDAEELLEEYETAREYQNKVTQKMLKEVYEDVPNNSNPTTNGMCT